MGAELTKGGAFVAKPDAACAEWVELTESGRREVRRWMWALEQMPPEKPISGWFTKVSAALGVSVGTVKSKYYALRKSGGDWRELRDKRSLPAADSSRISSKAFGNYFRQLCEENQRKTAPAIRGLLRQWRLRTPCSDGGDIPGYEGWPGWPKIPEGWSDRNLRRLQPTRVELRAMRLGMKAAGSELSQAHGTRVGLPVGATLMFDDVWHDNYVRCGSKVTRVLELGCIDLSSACRIGWGMKPRMPKAEGGHVGLTGAEMRSFLGNVLFSHGFAPTGCELVVEHGTAAISDEVERILYDATGGRVKVRRSTMEGEAQAVQGLWRGRNGGNPRSKGALESQHNPIHNELAMLLGQTGPDRQRFQESTAGVVKYQEQLLKALETLPPERAKLLQHPILDFHSEFVPLVADVYAAAINGRTEHRLEGWEQMGRFITEYTVAPSSEYWLAWEEVPEDSRAIIAAAVKSEPDMWSRTRALSPAEVWEQSKHGLEKIDALTLAEIIGIDQARPRRVKGAYFEFSDLDVSREPLLYEARVIDRDGRSRELKSGETYDVLSSPYAPDYLIVLDGKGRCLGQAPRVRRVSRQNPEELVRAWGHAAQRERDRLAEVNARHGGTAARAQDLREQNAIVIAGPDASAAKRKEASRKRAEKSLDKRQEGQAEAVDVEAVPVDASAADEPAKRPAPRRKRSAWDTI